MAVSQEEESGGGGWCPDCAVHLGLGDGPGRTKQGSGAGDGRAGPGSWRRERTQNNLLRGL